MGGLGVVDGDRHLITAVQEGTIHHIKHHVENLDKDVNHADQWNHHVIKHAAHRGDTEIAQYLIEKGADPHVRTQEGRTTLHAAAHQGRHKMVEYLLTHGVNVDMVDDTFGYTALMMAITELHHRHMDKDHESVMKVLVEAGTDLINIRGKKNGKNALDIMEKKRLFHPKLHKWLHQKADEQKKREALEEQKAKENGEDDKAEL